MSFTKQILVGLGAGILVGLFFGDATGAIAWAADGFVKLLQMTVLPYVTVSIVSSLGRLRIEDARRLGLRTGAVLIGLWAIALTFAFLIPLTFPRVESAHFFSSTLVQPRPEFDFVDLYIPSNPFYSLANNVVPAVVLFSLVLGIALIGVERKQVLLDTLDVASQALSRATGFIVRLTPYGLFVIAATAAGTMSLEQVGRLQVFLVSYVLVSLFVALWVLPGLIAALTPIRPREMFVLTRMALLTAFVAGDYFIVLPVLIEASRTLMAGVSGHDEGAATLPDVIVPASFNFPHTGKLLSLSFVLFAGWFADAVVSPAQYPRLAMLGLVSFFGSVNVAVPFLLDVFRIPADTFQLFLASGVVNARFGTLVAAVHTLAVAILGSCAVAGLIVFDRRRIVRYVAVTAVMTAVIIGGTRLLFTTVLDQRYTKNEVLENMHLLLDDTPGTVVPSVDPARAVPEGTPVLDAIRARGALRVGFLPDALPYAFFNGRGDLVGFDVEMAHRLATELGVGLELVRLERGQAEQAANDGLVDITMSGVPVTTERASRTLLSASYMDETLAFVVPDADRDRFESWDAIRLQPPFGIAVPDIPYYLDKVRRLVPTAVIHPVDSVEATFASLPPGVSALALPAERGSAWTLIHPEYSVVVPHPGTLKVPLAYPIARHDEQFAAFMDTWIDLKRKDGTIDALYRHWILGQDAAVRGRRWSILRNVLGWKG